MLILSSILGIETATIRNTASKEQEITFHTKPLSRLSPKFAQFCHRKKQPDGRFTLTCAQNKYDAFTCIALYAYHGKVPTAPKEIDQSYTQRLRWIYYVAEEFALHDLMNKTIDALRIYEFKYKQEIHIHAEEIYQNTSKGSLLRWYSAASAAWSWGRETGPATASQRDNRKKLISSGRGNPDIFADFHLVDLFHRDHIRGFDTDWRDVNDSGLPVCAFHCHAPGETCHRTGITEPEVVPEHVSRCFDGGDAGDAGDEVLLERSQIIDFAEDQDLGLSARQSTTPISPEAELGRVEDASMRAVDTGNNTTLVCAGPETTLSNGTHSYGMNGGQETKIPQANTMVTSKVREEEEVTKPSPATPLAPIRNPPSTRVVPPQNKSIDRSHKNQSIKFTNEIPTEDLYGASDVDMDRENTENSENSMVPAQRAIGSVTYDEQLANAWGVPLSSLPAQRTRIVPGTVVQPVKFGDTKRSQARRIVPEIRETPLIDEDTNGNDLSNTGVNKRKAIANEDEVHRDSHSAVTKKPKIAHPGTNATFKTPGSRKTSENLPCEVQHTQSESEPSEDDSSEFSSSDEDDGDNEEEEDEDSSEEIIDSYSSSSEESSYEDEGEFTSQSVIHRNLDQDQISDSNSISSSSSEPEELPFHDSGIHSHTSSKTTCTSNTTYIMQSQSQSQPHPNTYNKAVAPLRPGYCLIYNYKGRCNKACGLQHLCLKCDLRHSSLHHDKYQPDFRCTNSNKRDEEMEICDDWNKGRCAVRVTNCMLRHICGICKGGHRGIYHEYEAGFPKSGGQGQVQVQVQDMNTGQIDATVDSTRKHFRFEGRLDHNQTHSPEHWPSDSHSATTSKHGQHGQNGQNGENGQNGKNAENAQNAQTQNHELPFLSCQTWQRGTCIRKRTKCQLEHICERCGQLTHRTAKHDTYMSKTAPRA